MNKELRNTHHNFILPFLFCFLLNFKLKNVILSQNYCYLINFEDIANHLFIVRLELLIDLNLNF